MNPDNDIPQPNDPSSPLSYPQQPLTPQSPQQPAPQSQPPAAQQSVPPKFSKKKLILLIAVLLLVAGGFIFFLLQGDESSDSADVDARTESVEDLLTELRMEERDPTEAELSIIQDFLQGSTIHDAVNKYCQMLGWTFGFRGMDSGHILSEEYPQFLEEVTGEDPGFTPLKQVGDAAIASIDCVSDDRPEGSGLGNTMLFINEDNVWKVIQEDLSNSVKCNELDKYNISTELVDTCTPEGDYRPVDRNSL